MVTKVRSSSINDISSAEITAGLGFTPYNATNPSGYITGITSANVTSALGYTPYNATNPSGYITGITSGNVTSALGYTPYNATNPNGYITGINSTAVTNALGYTPYNATNPSGYITGITSGNVTSALGFTPANASSIPTKLSQLTNDSGYLTSAITVLGSFNIYVGGFGQIASRYETGITLPDAYDAGLTTKNLFLAFQNLGGSGVGDTYSGGGPDFTKVWWGWQLEGAQTALTAQTFWYGSPELLVSLYYDGDGQGSNLFVSLTYQVYVCYIK
jgi:hypothetical protein